MTASDIVTGAALGSGWQRNDYSERTGSLGALHEWRRKGACVRVFYTLSGAVRTGWIREGNRDWVRISGQRKVEKIVCYLKTGFLS